MNAALLSLALAAGLATGQFAPRQAGSDPLEPALEARVQKLGKELRCAVCQGLSIADSPSSMARAQLDTVRSLVAEGKSDQEVVAYFVARYGEWVLLEPKKEGFNWLVWAGPILLVIGGLFVILRQIQREPAPASAAPATPAAPTTPGTPEAEDPYLQAVRRELE
jgi:cytochrome c-type biogenesis protein CcmH